MTNRQRLLVAAVFVVALVGGGILALALVGGGGGSYVSPSPVAVATAVASPPTPTPPAATLQPSSAPSSEAPSPGDVPAAATPSVEASASVAPSVAPAPGRSASPRPTVAPGPPATIALVSLKLDAKDDPDGRNRRVSFRTQGTGTITVQLLVTSPQGSAVMCLSADGERLACRATADGRITAKTTRRRADFVLTLRGEGIETPVTDVTITFPARTPAVAIENARFDGTMYPDTNGIGAIVVPRSDGDVTIEAQWGGKPFPYELDLMQQDGPGAHVLANQGPATGVTEALPVTAAGSWKLVLQNIAEGFGVTLLDATIAWP